ncbi:phage holin family protein [Cellulomonas sp. Sa3CUA2]|uniref:Phage holin family protein n=1 Tax=Cellulomonas avistercoris TaxID=2762242 RepID=A0ABR8QCN3_9CELL|nr:phage holin family protein [Cellulomonas avistercoris]MBD7918176.1 phage holin family protein [Cellulomonas avistercoris]
MVRLLLRALIFLGSAALGLLAAAALVDRVTVTASGFVVTVVVFALAQSLLAPVVLRLSSRYAPALLGGIGLVSTFVALLLAHLLTGGLRISGVTAWVLATVVVWVVTALATFLLPRVLLREKHTGRTAARRAPD